jgi:hypothetical protein
MKGIGSGGTGQDFIDFRIVLYRACPLTYINVEIRPEVLLGEAEEMLQHPHLGHFGQGGRIFPQHALWDRTQSVTGKSFHFRLDFWNEDASLAFGAQLKNDLLIPLGLMEVP